VRAVHLVGAGGQEWWIEPGAGVARGDRLAELPNWCPETKVVRDDDWFRAPVVSVGRCGVIYAVVLEVTRQFRLYDESEMGVKWSTVRTKLADSAGKGENGKAELKGLFKKKSPQPDENPLRFFQVTVDLAKGEKCWVTRRWKTEKKGAHNISKSTPTAFDSILGVDPKPIAPLLLAILSLPEVVALKTTLGLTPVIGPIWVINIDALFVELAAMAMDSATMGEFLAKLTARVNGLTDAEVGAAGRLRDLALFASEMVIESAHEEKRWGFSHEIVDGHPDKRRGLISAHSAEFFFDATEDKYLQFVDKVLKKSVALGVPGYASLRFTGKSECLLAMERFALSVAIEIAVPRKFGVDGDLFEEFTDAMHKLAGEFGGIPHWGQRQKLTPEKVGDYYSGTLEKWRYVLSELEAGHKGTFSTKYSRAVGLELQDGGELDRGRTARDRGACVCMTAPLAAVVGI
jgi:hypothetical protein